MFAFQIYGDFSGYSDIAIGVSKLFGIRLMRNFNVPYFSRDIAEFWRRWHISLNTWFVDYVYIPLGGSRQGKVKRIRNTFSVFLLSGLWHGADWSFLGWGAWNAILFVPLVLINKHKIHSDTVCSDGYIPTLRESAMMGLTFLLVCIGWVLFRADNFSVAIDYLNGMFSTPIYNSFPSGLHLVSTTVLILMLVFIEWIMRKHKHPFEILGHGLLQYSPVRLCLYLFIVAVIFLNHISNSEFIYFQF